MKIFSLIFKQYSSADRQRDVTARILLCALTLTISAFLLFWNLGAYSLWSDEAMTALNAESVLETGDTAAVLKNGNIIAWGNGRELVGLKIRAVSPAMFYATAASFAVFGIGEWQARLPFALCGLAVVALMLWWARRASLRFLLALSAGIIGNASLFLYFRNCRYYALAVLAATIIAWCYWHWDGRKRRLAALAFASALLFAAHYSLYVMVYAALFVDYVLWRRKERTLAVSDWLVVWLPQIIINTAVFLVWCPLKTGTGGSLWLNDFVDRLTLWWWQVRDLNAVEFISWPMVLAALTVSVAAWWRNQQPLPLTVLRGVTAIVVMALALTLVTAQSVAATQYADVRYMLPALPLGIALTSWAVCRLSFTRWWLFAPLAVIVFFTNLTHGGMFFKWCGVRSTAWCYVRELLAPNPEPYRPTADWLNAHAADGDTVFVRNGMDDCYPLMFKLPRLLFAWQFEPERQREPQLASLSAAHFKGAVAPDWLVAFGPQNLQQLQADLNRYGPPNARYELAQKVSVLWKDLYRPELFWRTFQPIAGYNADRDVVFIFKRVEKSARQPEKKHDRGF